MNKTEAFKSVDSGHQQDSDVYVLIRLHKIKTWRQDKTMLHGYGQLESMRQFRRHL